MTYCESVGLKVGDKIRYLHDTNCDVPHDVINFGDIITLVEDDSSDCPEFLTEDGDQIFFDLTNRAWEKVDANIVETKFNLAELAKLIPKGYTVSILDCGRISILNDDSVCSHYVEDEKELLEKLDLIGRYEALEWI